MKRVNSKSGFIASLFLIVLIFQFRPLTAQDQVWDSLFEKQLQDIQKLLYQDRRNAQTWWYGWLAGYSVATVGQGIVYFSSDNKATRQDMALGSATTLLGTLGCLVTPIVPSTSSFRNPQIAEGVSGAQFETLENSEELLKEIARREKEGRSWKIHVVTGAVNIGSGLITWLGFKRTFRDGLENFALNTVITEAQIWTQPTRAIKDYENYCRKYNSGAIPIVYKPEKKWLIYAYPGGIAIKLDF